MEKRAWNQRIQVKIPGETEAGKKCQMEEEEVVVRRHPLEDMKLVSLAAVALQNLLYSCVAAWVTCFHCWAGRLGSGFHCYCHFLLIVYCCVVAVAVAEAAHF